MVRVSDSDTSSINNVHMLKGAKVEVTTQKVRFKSSEPETVAEGKSNGGKSATNANDALVANFGYLHQMTDYKRPSIYGGA